MPASCEVLELFLLRRKIVARRYAAEETRMNGRSISILHHWISSYANDSIRTRVLWSVQLFDLEISQDSL